MKTFYINILIMSVVANIAGWIGAFVYLVDSDYGKAITMLAVVIMATVVYTLVRKVME